MGKFLQKLFIKNYKNIDDPKVRNDYGKLAGTIGIITNFLLSIVKIIAGVIASSMALVADGLNNLSDTSSSVITLIGFKVSSKPADKLHPFGHQRVEYITGLIISFIILFIGVTLFRSGIEKIITPEEVEPSYIIFIILVLSIFLKIWQYFFYRQTGKLIMSKTLIATATDSFNDVITTTAVLISLIIMYFWDLNLDGYMTIIVAIYIVINGIKLVKETISPLIGEAPCSDLVKNVMEDILDHNDVLGIHDLVIHTYGPGKTFITAHVEVDSSLSVISSHSIADGIEKFINEKYNTNLVIHMDPIETKDEYTNQLKTTITNILQEINPRLNFHDFRVVKGTKHDNVIFDLEYPADFKMSKGKLLEVIKEKVELIDKRIQLIIEFDLIFKEEN